MGAMATYVRAGLPEVATALAALTGEPHPLAIKDPGTGRPSPASEEATASLTHVLPIQVPQRLWGGAA